MQLMAIVLKIINQKLILGFIIEGIATLVFILSVTLFEFYIAFFVYGLCYILYLVLNRKNLKNFASLIKRRKQ